MDEANVETHGFDPALHNNAIVPARRVTALLRRCAGRLSLLAGPARHDPALHNNAVVPARHVTALLHRCLAALQAGRRC